MRYYLERAMRFVLDRLVACCPELQTGKNGACNEQGACSTNGTWPQLVFFSLGLCAKIVRRMEMCDGTQHKATIYRFIQLLNRDFIHSFMRPILYVSNKTNIYFLHHQIPCSRQVRSHSARLSCRVPGPLVYVCAISVCIYSMNFD